MESLSVDKFQIINKIDNIINELKSIKNEINKDIDFDEIIDIEDVKEDIKHQETTKTLLAKSKQKTKLINNEEPNKGYKDFYDINSRPDIMI